MDMAKDRTSNLIKVSNVFPLPTSLVLLRPNLWFDAALATLQQEEKTILLTAREAAVLEMLLKAPRRWHLADDLAHRLKRRWPHINAHSVEQTICGLRQKLGESGTHPGILLSRYGLGYAIFPTASSDSLAQGNLSVSV